MSLWGKYDLKPQTNTATATVIVHAANSTVVGVNTKFAADFQAGDYLYVGLNNYVFTAIANNLTASVRSATSGGAMIGAGSNGAYVVSEKPLFITYSHTDGNANSVYGVSTSEMLFANTSERKAVTHAGWVKRTAGSGGRAGRVHYETLIAGSSITSDAPDDSKLPE